MLQSKYHEKLQQEGWESDPFQEKAVTELSRLLSDLKSSSKSFWPFGSKNNDVRGVYLYGGVGRGKSMLMDLFFDHAPEAKKRRIHFHEFMIETHDWLHQKRGDRVDDLMPRYAKYVAKSVKLLCFDEFHVTDVADAMLLGRMFTALFEEGVVVVATSNWAPDNLYEGGLQRDLFLPFIDVLKARFAVIHLDSDTDYRQISDPDQDMYYFSPLSAANKKKVETLFNELTDGEKITSHTLTIKGRDIVAEQTANGVTRFTFSQICEKPHAAEDFIAIAKAFHTVFLQNVPRLTYDRRNETKRLILLIDCLYEAGARLIISAAAPAQTLYHGDDHAFEFDRTISRLVEMQSTAYHVEAEKKRKGAAA